MPISPFCFCAPVTQAGLDALLQAEGDGDGAYRDSHPWLVAQRLWRDGLPALSDSAAPVQAPARNQVPIVLAVQETGALSHYAMITEIEVVELHRGSWESRARFSPLKPMNPVWQVIDSLLLWPAAEQLQREALEGLRKHRTALSATTLHPYAICETPEFMTTQ